MDTIKRGTQRPILFISCWCGNNSAREGFYWCDIDGQPQQLSDMLCCHRCGRITERGTGRYAGRRRSLPGAAVAAAAAAGAWTPN